MRKHCDDSRARLSSVNHHKLRNCDDNVAGSPSVTYEKAGYYDDAKA
jgi:hypothetical protein